MCLSETCVASSGTGLIWLLSDWYGCGPVVARKGAAREVLDGSSRKIGNGLLECWGGPISCEAIERGTDHLVQAIIVRALVAQQRFELGTSMKAWLFRILRNL